MLGRRLGDYVIISPLGAGGFGRVYLALQRPIDLKAALKVLNAPHRGPEALDRFEREARALAELNHPNIVRLLKYDVHDATTPYLVMEYVEGGRTLAQEIEVREKNAEPFSTDELRNLLDGILNGLAEAHQRGIVHRDIKPSNVMLQQAVGHPMLPRILDFGLAKFVSATAGSTTTSAGTPLYMAPEQLDGQEVGPSADTYAVAVMAFWLIFGVPPFEPNRLQKLWQQKLDAGWDPTAQLPADVPTPVLVRFRRALAVDPTQRYQTTKELRDMLHFALAELQSDAVAGLPTGTQPSARSAGASDSSKQHPPKQRRPGRPPLALALTLLALLATCVTVVLLTLDNRATETTRGQTTTLAPPAQSPPLASHGTKHEKIGLPWVLIRGGTFQIGVTDGRDPDRGPGGRAKARRYYQKEMSSFYIMRSEVTQAQYRLCVEAGACKSPKRTMADGPLFTYGRAAFAAHPVRWVNHKQAYSFCAWAGARLPTEIEWEFAARSRGEARPYPWGSDPPTCKLAVMPGRTADGCDLGVTAAVCSKRMGNTAQGLCDMAGNVREWVADCAADIEPRANPHPLRKAHAHKPKVFCDRAVRGGSFKSKYDGQKKEARALRTTERNIEGNNWVFGDLGFRCAR